MDLFHAILSSVSVESENHGCKKVKWWMPRLLPQSRARACLIPGRNTPLEWHCWQPKAANTPPVRSCGLGGDKGCASWLPRSGAGGAGMRLSSFVSSSVSGLSGHPPASGLQPRLPGPAAGGACCRSWSSTRSAGQRWARRGCSPAAVGQEPPWTKSWRWRSRSALTAANALSMARTALSIARCSGQGALCWEKTLFFMLHVENASPILPMRLPLSERRAGDVGVRT